MFSDSNFQVLKFSSSQILKFSDSQVLHHENQIRLADSLYKNYLPQYNFDEVKKAMEFFDSCQSSAVSRQHWRLFNKKVTDENKLIADRRLLTAAKAHYYHAVGLTERDDVVGACEHYLIALEIMEDIMAKDKRQRANDKWRKAQCPMSVDNKEDYEKIRFVALIYTRLGRLFTNENYCNLAILKYKKAFNYYSIINDTISISYTYKNIGNVYQLLSKTDSALYHYKKSLEKYSNLINRLDVEKCIAKIFSDKGENDSAYILIKNNLDKIENTNVGYSYYNILGEMYVEDKEYDSAIYYLTRSINSNISDIKINSAIKLSAIYDSIGDYEKKAYYDGIISKISIDDVNKILKNNKIQDVYDKYKKRKLEKERIENKKKTNLIASVFIGLLLFTVVIMILIWHKSIRKDKCIANKEEIINKINEKIKQNESEIKKLVEKIECHRSDIKFLKNEMAIKEREISGKETSIKMMENVLSIKEMELKRFQAIIHENRILIDKLNKDNIAKKKQIKCYLEKIEDNRQVINDKNRLISIATEGLVTRKEAIAENRNEIARLQAIIDENDKILNKISEDYKTNEERIAAYLEEIEKLKAEINETRINLNDLKFRNSFTEGRIKSQNAELKKKEELIKKYSTEISNLYFRLERNHIDISNLNNYLQSDVCSKILKEIKDLSDKKLKSNLLSPLSNQDFVLLLNSANHHLNYFMNDVANKYPKLKKDDLYYLCLVIIGLDNYQISSLFGVTYDATNKRKNKIRTILGVDAKKSLSDHLGNMIKMH